MADYIKREDAIAAAIEAADYLDGGYNIMRSDVIKRYINDIPAADVRENKPGRWEPIDDLPWFEAGTFICSACHSECDTHNGDYDLPYFCPNCGADMRGEMK